MTTELQRRVAEGDEAAAGPSVVELVRRLGPEMQKAVPLAFTGDRLVRLATTELRTNAKLRQCSSDSLLGALMLCAQLGMEPGGPLGRVYLVPRGREVVPIVGYRGLVELAYRSGRVIDINAAVVWQGEHFEYVAGDEPKITHHPRLDLDPEPDQFVAAYAIARLRDGGVLRAVIGPRQIRRAQGASASGARGPWSSDFEAMARKTAVRRLAALLPQSPDMTKALAIDEQPATPASQLVEAHQGEPIRPRRHENAGQLPEAQPAAAQPDPAPEPPATTAGDGTAPGADAPESPSPHAAPEPARGGPDEPPADAEDKPARASRERVRRLSAISHAIQHLTPDEKTAAIDLGVALGFVRPGAKLGIEALDAWMPDERPEQATTLRAALADESVRLAEHRAAAASFQRFADGEPEPEYADTERIPFGEDDA